MRSVVVVLPASMCAMIPMLRVFSRENFLGIDQDPGFKLGVGPGEKNGPLGPTRAAGLCRTGSRRYVLEVSICRSDPRTNRLQAIPRPWRLGDYSRGVRAS